MGSPVALCESGTLIEMALKPNSSLNLLAHVWCWLTTSHPVVWAGWTIRAVSIQPPMGFAVGSGRSSGQGVSDFALPPLCGALSAIDAGEKAHQHEADSGNSYILWARDSQYS